MEENENNNLNNHINPQADTSVYDSPEDIGKSYDELLEKLDWSTPESISKAMEILFRKLKDDDPIEEKELLPQGPYKMADNAKAILEEIYKLIQEIHIQMRTAQVDRFEEMSKEVLAETKSHINLDSMSKEMKAEYMKKETKYSLYQEDYSKYLKKIYEKMYNIAARHGQFFNDTQLTLKNRKRAGEIISRHSYFSLKTGKMETSRKFYKPEIEYGDPELVEGLNGYMELKDKAIEIEKQGTTSVHKTDQEKREKLVKDLNSHEEYTRKVIEKYNLGDYADGKKLDKSHEWSIKESQLMVNRSIESWFNDLIIYQELSLAIGEIMKYQYIKNYTENKADVELYIHEKKNGLTGFKDTRPTQYAKIERYVERAKFDPYIGGAMEGLEMEELRKPKYQNCLAKRLGKSDFIILIRLSESTWQVDKRRIQFMLINEKSGYKSRVYMVKFSDIEKKIFDIDSLLNMLIKIPIDSFAYLMLQNYVLKPTDEKETWMGLDHFMSTPLNLKNQFLKTKQLLKNDKYPVHRNTSDVEFFVLSLLTCSQKCMEFNHLGVLFKPRKRQGNVKQLVECFEAFGLQRSTKPERRYIKFLIKKIRSGYYDKDLDFKQIRKDLGDMNEVAAEKLMGTSSSNHMEIDKYFSDKYKDTIAASGKYHSMKTAETVAELLKEDFSHLKMSEVLSKLTESCLVRIFIKEMMGGMRDIAILSPQWKVACAILEELAKRVSVNSKHDLIQKERMKAELITNKIKKLDKEFMSAYGYKGRLLVLELDYKKWNAHQWTDILGEITSELIDRSFGYKTSAGCFIRTASKAYTSKMMQIELKRMGSALYSHLALVGDKSLLETIDLTESERMAIEKMIANPSSARKEYTGENMQNWIESALKAIKETGTGNDRISLSDLILMVRCPHGMGQGIFSTQSSIFGTIVLQPILEFLMKKFNVRFYDFVETSDDGNIYMMVPKTHCLIQSKYQSLFVEKLNKSVGHFGLELSVGKVKWDINGSFCFNSSDYDTNSMEYLAGLPAKVECLNRLWKGFGSLQYESPFMQYLRNSTWLIFLKNSYKINQKDMSKIAKWMKTVRDHVLRNNLVLETFTEEQTEFIYCTVPSLEMNGEIFFTNRKEVELLLAMSVGGDKSIDLRRMENLMRESECAIGFTFKNPKFDSDRKVSEGQDLLIARESGFDGQVKMMSHIAKMQGKCESFASFYRVLAAPWIEKDGMKVQFKLSDDENGLLSDYAESLTRFDHANWDHQYGFFIEDNDKSSEENKKMSAEIFKNVYTKRVQEGEDSELLISTLCALDGVDNDYLVKNLSSFIVPLEEGVFLGQLAMPELKMSIREYLLGMRYADPWVCPQTRRSNGWANYGVLVLETRESTSNHPQFKAFVMQDDHIFASYLIENHTMTKKKFDLPSAMSKYTYEDSDVLANSVLDSIWAGRSWLVQRLSSTLTKFDHIPMRKARLLMSDRWNMYERHAILSGRGAEYTMMKRKEETSEELK